MTLEPSDIREIKLNRSALGYEKAAVQKVMQDVAGAYEVVWRERAQLLDRTAALEAAIALRTELEELLRSTMIAAETVAADITASAHREAEVIVADANAEAQHVVMGAQRKRQELLSSLHSVQTLLQTSLGAHQPDEDTAGPSVDSILAAERQGEWGTSRT
jgi:cell division initiation protein